MAGFADIELAGQTLQGLSLGDPQAFTDAYGSLSAPVFTLAMRLLQDDGAAQDVMQDTFMELFEQGHKIRDSGAVVAWVRKVTVNHCLMRLRSPWHKRRVQWLWGRSEQDMAHSAGLPGTHQVELNPANPDALTENLPDIEQALARLPVDTRLVIWLHDVEGYTHKEIGQLLRRSTGYSKSQLARGYQRLAHWYQTPPHTPLKSGQPGAVDQVQQSTQRQRTCPTR